MRASRDLDRDRLLSQIRTDEYRDLLCFLQRGNPFLRQFPAWPDVLEFMRAGTSRDPLKDEVLRPILESHAVDGDPRWREILLAVFWPGLESLHYRMRGRDPDEEDRWQDIAWVFLQVVGRIDVRRRSSRLVQKIFNDTVHRLHDRYRGASSRADREIPVDPEEAEFLAGAADDPAIAAFEIRHDKEPEVRRFREHLEAGRLGRGDFLLLVGTEVYGLSVANTAALAGLDYQVARKRRQRALAAIRRFLGEGG